MQINNFRGDLSCISKFLKGLAIKEALVTTVIQFHTAGASTQHCNTTGVASMKTYIQDQAEFVKS